MTKFDLIKLEKSILEFWQQIANLEPWHYVGKETDKEIRKTALPLYNSSVKIVRKWVPKNINGFLAKIIIFDQIPRCIFRSTKKVFNTDSYALTAAKRALKLKLEQQISDSEKCILSQPLMHSEDLNNQELALKLLQGTANKKLLAEAEKRYLIIKKFSRFPYRNLILGRKLTKDEWSYLRSGSEQIHF